ncbi:hypothetical protein ABC766_32210 (plasmid) [Methylobacterium fujisawaense]|jgi:hypothetical protein|uniref:hypothetical protein n=1 Tax=Methylobacterium fujisawaense TaxID=107400 RepID=UPI0031F56A28
MADDQSGGANPSKKERDAGERAGRKRLGESGLPQAPPSPKEQDAANRTKVTVRHSLKRGSQETERATGKK